MFKSLRNQFLAVASLLIMLGFAISAQLTSAAPRSQVLAATVVVLVTLPSSYWLVYRHGISF
ncbi:DUF7534 family protein [Haloplanus rubicundus]